MYLYGRIEIKLYIVRSDQWTLSRLVLRKEVDDWRVLWVELTRDLFAIAKFLFTEIWRYIYFQNGGRPPSWNCLPPFETTREVSVAGRSCLSNFMSVWTQIWRPMSSDLFESFVHLAWLQMFIFNGKSHFSISTVTNIYTVFQKKHVTTFRW